MKTTDDRRVTRLRELTSLPYAACEAEQLIDGIRKAVAASGLDGCHAAAVKLQRVKRALRSCVLAFDAVVTQAVACHQNGAR